MFWQNQYLLYPIKTGNTCMDNITYTHKELATLVNVSETTIKSYRKKIPHCLPISSIGKPIRFSKEALDVCKRIKELFSEGMAVVDVQRRLAMEYEWIDEPIVSQETNVQESNNVADVAIPLNAIAQGVMNILQQQKDLMRRFKELEERVESIKMESSTQVQYNEEKKDAPVEQHYSMIPSYLMEYPLVVQISKGSTTFIEGLGLLPQFTLFDLLAKLNHNFKYPEHYVPFTTLKGQMITITFIQEEALNKQSFSIQLSPIQYNEQTALLVVDFYVNDQKTPVETLMGFIHL